MIYLASTSPRRQNLLRMLGIKFKVLKPKFVEPDLPITSTPQKFAKTLALLKALSALCNKKVKSGFIIGVDTVVVINNHILGKPRTPREAKKMLKILSGKTHKVITGICVIRVPDRKILTAAESTNVSFRRLSPQEIDTYITTPEPFDKAGAYAVQGKAAAFVKKVNGCYLNVIGLPVNLLLNLLYQAGWEHWHSWRS